MTIKADRWIRRMAREHGMIEPFEPDQVRHTQAGKVISFGTSSYGYDVRCSDEFKLFTKGNVDTTKGTFLFDDLAAAWRADSYALDVAKDLPDFAPPALTRAVAALDAGSLDVGNVDSAMSADGGGTDAGHVGHVVEQKSSGHGDGEIAGEITQPITDESRRGLFRHRVPIVRKCFGRRH